MLWLLIPVFLAALIALCWWGSNIVFQPPNKVPLTVFPGQFALPSEDVEFKTADGVTLRGWTIPARSPTDRTVMMCHGWGDNKGYLLERFRFLVDDFNLFFFDSRAHGDSGGDFSTIGCLESLDFEAALGFLKADKPAWIGRLGLYGLSMGAAIAIRGMAYAPEVRCAVLEAPFRSFTEVVLQFTSNRFAIPYFPIVWMTLLIIRLRLGVDPEPYSPTYHIGKLTGRPLQFIAGQADRLMPLDKVQRLYAEAGEPKELWVIPGAEHGHCQDLAAGEYEQRLTTFFKKNL